MPPTHRNTDSRYCGALTIVKLQTTVFVNNLLWSVQGDIDTHCDAGALIAVYGTKNVYLNNILAICAPGDIASPDFEPCACIHPGCGPVPWPMQGSPNTFVYAGGGGG